MSLTMMWKPLTETAYLQLLRRVASSKTYVAASSSCYIQVKEVENEQAEHEETPAVHGRSLLLRPILSPLHLNVRQDASVDDMGDEDLQDQEVQRPSMPANPFVVLGACCHQSSA